jgi:hypothetical protein
MSEENVVDPQSEISEHKPRLDSAQLKAIVEALVFASPEPLTRRFSSSF